MSLSESKPFLSALKLLQTSNIFTLREHAQRPMGTMGSEDELWGTDSVEE